MDHMRILSGYDYAELRIEKGNDNEIRIKDEEVRQSAGRSSGMSVRVLDNGSWGFASGSSESLERLLERAGRLARLGRSGISIRSPEPVKRRVSRSADLGDMEEQVEALLEASKEMGGDRITSRTISLTGSNYTTEFYNSEGSEIIQETGFLYLSCTAIAREDGLIQRGAERTWSRESFSGMDVLGTARKAKDKALRLLKAGPPPKGRFTVVLDPEMTGVLAHEAIGHACEADAVADKESVLHGKAGQRIGSDLVTIADDPTADDFGHYDYDDEGVQGMRTTLVDKGILREFMDSRESAQALDIGLNGHARAESYDQVPVVRMSNTYFQRGGSPVDEVFGIKSGVYLKGMKGGSVDIFSGGFMFKAEEAYSIEHGEKGRIMRDVTFSGNILKTLLKVECVGDDFGTSPGICGKASQAVPVSDGGPHIRISDVAIG